MFSNNSQGSISEKFCLISWNIYKRDHKNTELFHSYVKKLHQQYAIDIYCLQESKHSDDSKFPIEKYHINFASNIEFKNHNYGVTTASKIVANKNIKVLTTHKESVINTHKASLITHYPFEGNTLTVVNIHAINFKTNKVYEYEFEKIKELLQIDKVKNPIIIAGDFNTWNRYRIKLIKDFCREYGFKVAYLDDSRLVKTFQNNPLDFVLYRGLDLERAFVLDCDKVSDHNPIITYFKKAAS